MPAYISPTGNPEVWDAPPPGYMTPEQWAQEHPAPKPPPPTLEEARTGKRLEIQRARSAVLAYMLAETPAPTPIDAALAVEDMRADDPDGLAYVRSLADARRTELLALVDAAQSVAEVDAITVSYPV